MNAHGVQCSIRVLTVHLQTILKLSGGRGAHPKYIVTKKEKRKKEKKGEYPNPWERWSSVRHLQLKFRVHFLIFHLIN